MRVYSEGIGKGSTFAFSFKAPIVDDPSNCNDSVEPRQSDLLAASFSRHKNLANQSLRRGESKSLVLPKSKSMFSLLKAPSLVIQYPRVLLVDDDEFSLLLTHDMLHATGISSETAQSGVSALQIVQERIQ